MSLNSANCPNCGAIYQKNFRNMCMDCSAVSDDYLNRCTKYLWKNPKSTTEQVSLALDIETAIIISFIKKGSIPKSFPNLTYPCDSCGSPITANRLCRVCTGTFKDLAQTMTNQKNIIGNSGFKIRDRLNK